MASFPSAEKDTYATILTLWRSELGHGELAAVDVLSARLRGCSHDIAKE